MGVRQLSKHDLATAWRPRYLKADRVEKGRMLDEFVTTTGYHRKHAVELLRHGPPPQIGRASCRERVYVLV